MSYMDDRNPKEFPLITGGQGRSGADLEDEAVFIAPFALGLLVVLLLIGYFA